MLETAHYTMPPGYGWALDKLIKLLEIGYIQIYDDLHLPIIKICVFHGFCKACSNSAIPDAVVIIVVRVVVIIKYAEQ